MNPKFEGYKLAPLSQSDAVISYPLPRLGATQATVSGRSQLSFKEVQHRIRFNHLALGQDGQTVGYIDKEGLVVLGTFEQVCEFAERSNCFEYGVDATHRDDRLRLNPISTLYLKCPNRFIRSYLFRRNILDWSHSMQLGGLFPMALVFYT